MVACVSNIDDTIRFGYIFNPESRSLICDVMTLVTSQHRIVMDGIKICLFLLLFAAYVDRFAGKFMRM